MFKKTVTILLLVLSCSLVGAIPGDVLPPLMLADVNKNTCWLMPANGVSTVVFYDEYGNIDNNEFLFKMIYRKAGSGNIIIYRVINMVPTWYLPDSLIYRGIKEKIEETVRVKYLFDDSENLKIKWRLKENPSGSAVIFINSDGALMRIVYGNIRKKQARDYVRSLKIIK